MISKYNHKELNWIDLESPTEAELEHIIEKNPLLANLQKEIENPSEEDIIKYDDDFLFATLNLPTNRIIVIFNDSTILTIHEHPIKAFTNLGNEIELCIAKGESLRIYNNNLLFVYLLKNFYLENKSELVKSLLQIKKMNMKIKKTKKSLKLFIFISILFLVTTIIFICL